MTVGQIDEMPSSEYLGWIEMYAIEPWGLAVADTLNAHGISVLVNLKRDHESHPEPYLIKDFRLYSDQEETSAPVDPPTVDGKTGDQWKLIFAAEAMQAIQNKERERAIALDGPA